MTAKRCTHNNVTGIPRHGHMAMPARWHCDDCGQEITVRAIWEKDGTTTYKRRKKVKRRKRK